MLTLYISNGKFHFMLSRYRWATSIVYILLVVCLSSSIISVKVYISEHTLPWDIVDASNGFSYSYIPQWLNEMPFFYLFYCTTLKYHPCKLCKWVGLS